MDLQAFREKLSNSTLLKSTPEDVNELVSAYNDTLSTLLDDHAPEVVRQIPFRPDSEWFNEDVLLAKRVRRRAERRFDKRKLTVFRKDYKKWRNKCTQVVNKAKRSHYHQELVAVSSNPKKTFQVVEKLTGANEPVKVLPSVDRQIACDNLSRFFSDKIISIRSSLPLPDRESPSSCDFSGIQLSQFSLITDEQLLKLIKTSKKRTSSVDPIPTTLFLKCLDILLPIVKMIINGSLATGTVPSPLKKAVIRPLLKKTGLDPDEPKNYRPVSNLSFISKLLERAVATQLMELLRQNQTLDAFQSAYRPDHSTETALIRVMNDLLQHADKGDVSLLLLLDLSAAFDTIDHPILISRLENDTGVKDVCLRWFQSYLANRMQHVDVDGMSSTPVELSCGVPQGSVLGPVLFCIYTAKLGTLIEECGVNRQLFADDTGVYDSFPPDTLSVESGVQKLENCCSRIKDWMSTNMLKLNDDKTEALLCGKPSSLNKLATQVNVSIGGHGLEPSSSVRNLGLIIDKELCLQDHVSTIVKSCNHKMRQFGRLRPFLTLESAKMVAAALILSRLDYCNGCLWGINDGEMHRLQVVQNTAARIVSKTRKRDHITPVLNDLHWLQVKSRVDHKVLSLTYKSINKTSPAYLSSLVREHQVQTNMVLRSAKQGRIHDPRRKENVRHGQRAFANAAPKLWNDIPVETRKADSIISFKRQLKTHLFSKQLE
jgi:hypothetical protein